jgi:hypothetical protein
MGEMSPRDMLIEMHTDVKWLKEVFNKHLNEHFQIRLLMIGSLLSAVAAVVIAICF